MYKVKYYMSGGTLTSKTFPSFHEATVFAVYSVGYGNVYGIDRV